MQPNASLIKELMMPNDFIGKKLYSVEQAKVSSTSVVILNLPPASFRDNGPSNFCDFIPSHSCPIKPIRQSHLPVDWSQLPLPEQLPSPGH